MIANLIFDLSAYGGSANFTATTPTDLINELNTLTGVTWFWDPLDCKPKSNFYGGALTPIPTQYIISLLDDDGDSTGYCNAGTLDFTKFNEIDLSAYGGSANTSVSNSADIVTAFASLTPSLTVSISGCNVIIDNWNRNSTPTNVQVNNIPSGCTTCTGTRCIALDEFEMGSTSPTLTTPFGSPGNPVTDINNIQIAINGNNLIGSPTIISSSGVTAQDFINYINSILPSGVTLRWQILSISSGGFPFPGAFVWGLQDTHANGVTHFEGQYSIDNQATWNPATSTDGWYLGAANLYNLNPGGTDVPSCDWSVPIPNGGGVFTYTVLNHN